MVVDCGSTTANILESELFGHLKGSFTHALKNKKGLIQEAQDGIRNLSVDCRVIAATNADLPDLIKKGSFREDLYFRFKGITLRLPPLRERREDIP